MQVSHVDNLELKITVERIIKKSTELQEGTKTVKRQLIVGVKCHWFDENNKLQTAIFNTRELIKRED